MGRHSLDGDYARTFRLRHRDETTVHQHPVQQNGTRTAFSLAASFFRACQFQIVPKHVQQSFHVVGKNFLCFAIDGEREFTLRTRFRRRIHAVPRTEDGTACSSESGPRASNKSSGSNGIVWIRTPVASSMALMIAGAGPSMGNSPIPLAPCAP